MNEELRKEIEQLRREKAKALRARYLELFGEESKSSNQAHLFRRVASTRALRVHQAQMLFAAGNPDVDAPPEWRQRAAK
jgi:hypothetical protein